MSKTVLIIDAVDLQMQKEFLDAGWTVYLFIDEDFYDKYSFELKEPDFIIDQGFARQYGNKLFSAPYDPASNRGKEWIEKSVDLIMCMKPWDEYDLENLLGESILSKIPWIGVKKKAFRLEDDRVYANKVFTSLHEKCKSLDTMKLSVEKALQLLKDDDSPYVLKAAVGSGSEVGRTIVPYTNEELVVYLQRFPSDRKVILQRKIDYVQFGMTCLFDGTSFVNQDGQLLTFLNFEQKGSVNEDIGRVFTNEVATVAMKANMSDTLNEIMLNMTKVLKNQFVGFIDIMFAYDSVEDDYYLIEFTPRFGIPTYQTLTSLVKNTTYFAQIMYDVASKDWKNWTKNDGFDENVCVSGCWYMYGTGIFLGESQDSSFTSVLKGLDAVRSQGIKVGYMYGYPVDREDKTLNTDMVTCPFMERAAIAMSVDSCRSEAASRLNKYIGYAKGYAVIHRTDCGSIVDSRMFDENILDSKSQQKLT